MRELAASLKLALLTIPDVITEPGRVVDLGLGDVMRVPALGAIGARFALIDGLADDVLKVLRKPRKETYTYLCATGSKSVKRMMQVGDTLLIMDLDAPAGGTVVVAHSSSSPYHHCPSW